MKFFKALSVFALLLIASTDGALAQNDVDFRVTQVDQQGNKVFLGLNLSALETELDNIYTNVAINQTAIEELSWSDVLQVDGDPGQNVNLSGYDLLGARRVVASGGVSADSLSITTFADLLGRLQVQDVVSFGDSLQVTGFVEFADSLDVAKAVAIGETLMVTGVTSLMDTVYIGRSLFVEDVVQADSVVAQTLVNSPALFTDSLHSRDGNLALQSDADITLESENASIFADLFQAVYMGEEYSASVTAGLSPFDGSIAMVGTSTDEYNSGGMFYTTATGSVASVRSATEVDGVITEAISQNTSRPFLSEVEHIARYANGDNRARSDFRQRFTEDGLIDAVFTVSGVPGENPWAGLLMTRTDWDSPMQMEIVNSEGPVELTTEMVLMSEDATVTETLYADSLVVTDVIQGQIGNLNNHTTDGLTEGTSNLYHTTSRVRQALSATDAGGAGSFTYNNTSGVFTYTGPDTASIRGHFTAGTGIDLASGVVAIEADLLARIDSLEGVIADLASGASEPFRCGQSSVSYDAYQYSTVRIGGQCWFAENLRTAVFADGDSIPSGLNDTEWQNETGAAMTVYDEGGPDEEQSLELYGRLYNWYAASSGELCPTGWHVPTRDEFAAMVDLLGGGNTAANKLKAMECDWPAWDGMNSCGFGATPGGQRPYNSMTASGYFWVSTEQDASLGHRMEFTSSGYFDTTSEKYRGSSVRCLQDDATARDVATVAATDVAATTATISGNFDLPFNSTLTDAGFVWASNENLSSPTTTAVTPVGNVLTLDLTGLATGQTYYYAAFASTNGGTLYGDTLSFTTVEPPAVFNSCGDELHYNGYNYETVDINGTCWFRENLRSTLYNDGTEIPAANVAVLGDTQEERDANLTRIGRLYRFAPVATGNLCPTGWYVPTSTEFSVYLIDAFGGGGSFSGTDMTASANAALRATTWGEGTDFAGTNVSGFTALPYDENAGPYDGFGNFASFWSSDTPAYSWTSVKYFRISGNSNYVSATSTEPQSALMSIRCVEESN